MIVDYELFAVDAGWRNYHFLKLVDDSGHVGWSEFDEAFSPPGVSLLLPHYLNIIRGRSALDHERLFNELYAMSRPAPVVVTAECFGAIENALLDLKGKLLGVPCHVLLGGKQRETIPVYWSHCASWRINHPAFYSPTISDLAGVRKAGEDAKNGGFKAAKTNMFTYNAAGRPKAWMTGFGSPWEPGLNITPKIIRDMCDHVQALKDGAGPNVEILIDLNFNAKPAGYLQLIRALNDFDLYWIELDLYNPEATANIRKQSTNPIASCETLFGLRQFLPFFQNQSVDFAIVDVIWNGAWQSMKVAHAAEAHDINVAGHNFYSHMATMINVHYLAAVPNAQVLELDVDRLSWDEDLFNSGIAIENGEISIPETPGWGIEPNEDAMRSRPAREITSYLGFEFNNHQKS